VLTLVLRFYRGLCDKFSRLLNAHKTEYVVSNNSVGRRVQWCKSCYGNGLNNNASNLAVIGTSAITSWSELYSHIYIGPQL
jgi:excinuclease UvrABC ATPase subunit